MIFALTRLRVFTNMNQEESLAQGVEGKGQED